MTVLLQAQAPEVCNCRECYLGVSAAARPPTARGRFESRLKGQGRPSGPDAPGRLKSAGALDDTAVRGAELVRMLIGDGVPSRQRLVHLDAPTRLLTDPRVAVLDPQRAVENVLHQRRVVDVLVNAEI